MITSSVSKSAGIILNSIGGFGWVIKLPLSIIAFIRTVFGTTINYFCCPANVYLCADKIIHVRGDFLLPPCILLVGAFRGHLMSYVIRPVLSRMFTIVPQTQLLSYISVGAGHCVNELEKGWIGVASKSLSLLSTSLIAQYAPMISIGLGIFIIYLL